MIRQDLVAAQETEDLIETYEVVGKAKFSLDRVKTRDQIRGELMSRANTDIVATLWVETAKGLLGLPTNWRNA